MNYFFKNKIFFSKIIRCQILIGIFFFSTGLHAQYSRATVDSLEAILNEPSVSDNDLFLSYKKLSNAYLYTDTEKSLKYAMMGVHLAQKKNNSYQVAEFYYNVGNSYYYASRLDSTMYYYEQSFEIAKYAEKSETEDKENIDYLLLRLFYSIGTINTVYGRYDLAVDYYLKALDISEKINEPDQTAALYLGIANAYIRMSNFLQAEVYYLKGEKICRELNDSIGLADVYQGLCSIFIDKEDYSQALKYGEESYRILSIIADTQAVKLMYANQGLTDVWLKIPDYGKALEYARKTVEYARQTGNSSDLSIALYMLSVCYLKQEKYRESEKIAFEALEADTTDIYMNSVLYGNIAQANIWLGNPVKSIEYFRKTTNAIRAYSNRNFQSSLSEMEVKHETEKKELKIVALEDEKRFLEKEKRLMTGLAITGGIVLLLTLASFFFLWRWTVQKKRIVEQQKKIAEQQVKQLEQEKQLVATQAVLDGETRERTRLARDLHDGLGSMLTGVKLNLLEMKKGAILEYADLERFDNVLGLVDRSVHEMRHVAHHLMPDSLTHFGLKSAVNDFCSDMPSVRFAYYGDESRLDAKLEVMIYRSIHELVNNALKHAGADKIIVQIFQEPDRIDFTVQDNGCGFDPSTVTNGMGLQNIRTRVAAYNGIINIDSKEEVGTEINVELRIEN